MFELEKVHSNNGLYNQPQQYVYMFLHILVTRQVNIILLLNTEIYCCNIDVICQINRNHPSVAFCSSYNMVAGNDKNILNGKLNDNH